VAEWRSAQRTSSPTHCYYENLFSLLLAAVPPGLFAASGTAIPGGNQTAPFVIAKPGAYHLAANRVMTATGKPAIEITASDVTLDLNGSTLGYIDSTGAGDAREGLQCRNS
jgi:hypothetical protein